MTFARRILPVLCLSLLPDASCSPSPATGGFEARHPSKKKTIAERVADAPDDVERFIVRRAGCNHFWGEAGSGFAPREAQVQQALAELQCNSLDGDEALLIEKYSSNEEIRQLIAETSDYSGWPAGES